MRLSRRHWFAGEHFDLADSFAESQSAVCESFLLRTERAALTWERGAQSGGGAARSVAAPLPWKNQGRLNGRLGSAEQNYFQVRGDTNARDKVGNSRCVSVRFDLFRTGAGGHPQAEG